MKLNFSRLDRILITIASLGGLIFSYLLYDNSLFYKIEKDNSLSVIGNIANQGDDVRRKLSNNFIWLSINKTQVVYQGDTIFTGPTSRAAITLADSSHLYIEPNSLIVLILNNNKLSLDLKFGDIKQEISDQTQMEIFSGGEKIEFKEKKVIEKEKKSLSSKKVFHVKKDIWSAPEIANLPSHLMEVRKVAPAFDLLPPPELAFDRGIDDNPSNIAPPKEVVVSQVEIPKLEEPPKIIEPPKVIEPELLNPPEIDESKWTQIVKFKRNEKDEFETQPSIDIEWSSKTLYETYQLQISQNMSFDTLLRSEDLSKNIFQFQTTESGILFIRVRGLTNEKKESPWSKVATLTLEVESPESQLRAPILLSKKIQYDPTINITENAPHLQWKSVPGAFNYLLEISENKTFDKISYSKSLKGLSNDWSNYNIGTNYYRVSAISKKGKQSPFSIGEINVRISSPKLNPLQNITATGKTWDDKGITERLPASWTPNPLASDYRLEVSNEQSFKNKKIYNSKTAGYEIPLTEPGDYFVRVVPMNKEGIVITDFSNVEKVNYTLRNPVKVPDLREPHDDTTIFLQTSDEPYIWLDWNMVPQVINFEVEVDTSNKFSNPLIHATVEKNSYLIQKKVPMGKIFWRVRARNEIGISDWSKTYSFSLFTTSSREEQK